MLIALAQVNPTIGALDENCDRIIKYYHDAAARGAELIIFSELSLSGYPPKDLLLYNSFLEKEQSLIENKLLPLTADRGPALLIGTSHRHDQKLYNSALLLEKGRIKAIHHKSLLPNYDIFDEKRYYRPATSCQLTMLGDLPTAITICEDIWNDRAFFTCRNYDSDPLELLFKQGAHLLINISASPYHLGKQSQREKLLSYLAAKYQSGIIYLNQVGGNDELIFDGASLVYNASGQLIYRGAAFQEELIFIDSADLYRPQAKELPPLNEGITSVYEALRIGLCDYILKTGFKKVVLGLSGGIDSAVVAALAAEALGRENVLGVMMPSPYSSDHSLSDGIALAENLGIPYRVHRIDQPFKTFLGLLNEDGQPLGDLAEENLQARIRGTIIMHISNREGFLALATGNKSELAVGYCTLYGDMAGGLAVIADLPKVMVYELAAYLNSRPSGIVIPENTINKPPSAELRPDQKDEDSLPPYEILDPILQAYIEENRSAPEIIAAGFDPATVRRVISMVDRAEFKRRQAAPGLRVTTRAFGSGRRMPIARFYYH